MKRNPSCSKKLSFTLPTMQLIRNGFSRTFFHVFYDLPLSPRAVPPPRRPAKTPDIRRPAAKRRSSKSDELGDGEDIPRRKKSWHLLREELQGKSLPSQGIRKSRWTWTAIEGTSGPVIRRLPGDPAKGETGSWITER